LSLDDRRRIRHFENPAPSFPRKRESRLSLGAFFGQV
jgi:hypothetical protein